MRALADDVSGLVTQARLPDCAGAVSDCDQYDQELQRQVLHHLLGMKKATQIAYVQIVAGVQDAYVQSARSACAGQLVQDSILWASKERLEPFLRCLTDDQFESSIRHAVPVTIS